MKENIIIQNVNSNITHRPGSVLVGMQDALIDGMYVDCENYNFYKDPLAFHNTSPTTIPYSHTYTQNFQYCINESVGQVMLNSNMDATNRWNKYLTDSSSQISSNTFYDQNLSFHYLTDVAGICTFSHRYNRYLEGIYKTTSVPLIFVKGYEGNVVYISTDNRCISFNTMSLNTIRNVNMLLVGYSKIAIYKYDENSIRYFCYSVESNNLQLKYAICDLNLNSFNLEVITESTIPKLRYNLDPNGFWSNAYTYGADDLFAVPTLYNGTRGAAILKYNPKTNELLFVADQSCTVPEINVGNNRAMLRIIDGSVILLQHFVVAENQNMIPVTIWHINLNLARDSRLIPKYESTLNSKGLPLQSHKSIHLLDSRGKYIAMYSASSKSYLIMKYNHALAKYIPLRIEQNTRSVFIDLNNNKLISYKNDNSIRLSVLNPTLRMIYVEYSEEYIEYKGVNITTNITLYVLRNAEFESKDVTLQIVQGGIFSDGSLSQTFNTDDKTVIQIPVIINSDKNLIIRPEFAN